MNISQIGSTRAPKTMHFPHLPNLRFWVVFVALNGLLFLPLYALNLQDNTFLPPALDGSIDTSSALIPLFTWRNNLDIFRLHAELILLVSAWVLLPFLWQARLTRWFRVLFTLFFFFTFFYQTYESGVSSLYQRQPVMYHDFRFFVDGIGFALGGLRLSVGRYVALVLLAALLFWLLNRLIRLLLDTDSVRQLSIWTRIAVAGLVLFIAASGIHYQNALASQKMAVSSITFKIVDNWQASVQQKEAVESFDPVTPHAIYNYKDHDLLKKPDIYLIFIESYGSVLYKRKHFVGPYTELLTELKTTLDVAGWSATSALSLAPTWGGGSWMSYTSAQFGIEIDNQPQFLALREAFQQEPYPHLGWYLQNQGYEHVRVSSMWSDLRSDEATANINFYRPDRWLEKDDLAYEGSLYGWGPAPPDQYVLHFARETIDRTSNHPTFFFYLTQNSHYPWAPLPALADDWHDLNRSAAIRPRPINEPIPHPIKKQNYLDAITYELRTLVEFIIAEQDEDTIFVLIGDHQPPAVSNRADGFDTPIHVISKDSDFITSLSEYGFKEGLVQQDLEPMLHHAGFYSMLTRTLLANYGAGVNNLPPYLPTGISESSIAPEPSS